METLREIRRHIRSVRNIAQITRAMEMVAASKMIRAQQQALASRPYTQKAWEVLTYLAAQPERIEHPLYEVRPVKAICIVLITSDRGLCGPYNHNIIRATAQFMLEKMDQGIDIQLITVGQRGRDFMLRYGHNVIAEFTKVSDRPTLLEIAPIARVAMEQFISGQVDEVYLAYTRFVSTLTQRPTIQQLLPIEPPKAEERWAALYIFEPDPQTVLNQVLPRFTELQVYHAILEAQASEHSARMVAMRNATENANELITELTLRFNKVRQWNITREMMDIAGGAEALRKARASIR
ncbi:MAG: ATP synthase F1 subunit gamma [Chloroflexi bacterium]|nr:MAG: ATP synthase F1 subunit gamma [Chloroflexota bacterium]